MELEDAHTQSLQVEGKVLAEEEARGQGPHEALALFRPAEDLEFF